MLKYSLKARFLGAVAVGGLLVAVAGSALADHGPRYEVTITNLTRGQPLTPPVIVAHTSATTLFEAGAQASDGLTALAEDAITTTLVEELAANPEVTDFVVAVDPVTGVILPGASLTVEIATHDGGRLLSAVGMLPDSNDAFAAIRDVALPRGSHVLRVHGDAYDAGTEANNEDCAFIPGPSCGMQGVRDTAGAEGFVHIHSGIYGITGHLDPAVLNWQNPVIELTIRKVQ